MDGARSSALCVYARVWVPSPLICSGHRGAATGPLRSSGAGTGCQLQLFALTLAQAIDPARL